MRPTTTEVAERMRQYALGLTEDATILAEMVDSSGDGQRILSTLSMETLMKAVGLVESGLALLWHIVRDAFVEGFFTVRAAPGWWAREEIEYGLPDGGHAWLWRRPYDSFFSVPLL